MSLNSWFEFLKKKKKTHLGLGRNPAGPSPLPLSLFFFITSRSAGLPRRDGPRGPATSSFLCRCPPGPARQRQQHPSRRLPPAPSAASPRRSRTAASASGRSCSSTPRRPEHSAALSSTTLCFAASVSSISLCCGGVRPRRAVHPRRSEQGRELDMGAFKAGRAPARARGARRRPRGAAHDRPRLPHGPWLCITTTTHVFRKKNF